MSKKLVLISCLGIVSLYAAESAFPIGISSIANGKIQEDRIKAVLIKGQLFLGMYDGHGGLIEPQTVDLLCEDLHKKFEEHLSSLSIKKAFKKAVDEVDSIARQQYHGGSTAVAAYIRDNYIHVFNIGDSCLIVEKNGIVGFATEGHTFKNAKERTRVLQEEGIFFRFVNRTTKEVVRNNPWRINGLVPVRIIGDKWHKGDLNSNTTYESRGSGEHKLVYQIYKEDTDEKMYDVVKELTITPKKGQVIADPECTKLCLTQENRWIILATDGLTDVISNDEIVQYVVQQDQKGMLPSAIAEFLTQQAIQRGSRDNITVMICDLLQLKKR